MPPTILRSFTHWPRTKKTVQKCIALRAFICVVSTQQLLIDTRPTEILNSICHFLAKHTNMPGKVGFISFGHVLVALVHFSPNSPRTLSAVGSFDPWNISVFGLGVGSNSQLPCAPDIKDVDNSKTVHACAGEVGGETRLHPCTGLHQEYHLIVLCGTAMTDLSRADDFVTIPKLSTFCNST